jgi:hypothetical protein
MPVIMSSGISNVTKIFTRRQELTGALKKRVLRNRQKSPVHKEIVKFAIAIYIGLRSLYRQRVKYYNQKSQTLNLNL